VLAHFNDGPNASDQQKAVPTRPDFLARKPVAKLQYETGGTKAHTGPEYSPAARRFLADNNDVEAFIATGWIVTPEDISRISVCERLRYLRVHKTENPETLDELRAINQLKSLIVNDELILDRD